MGLSSSIVQPRATSWSDVGLTPEGEAERKKVIKDLYECIVAFKVAAVAGLFFSALMIASLHPAGVFLGLVFGASVLVICHDIVTISQRIVEGCEDVVLAQSFRGNPNRLNDHVIQDTWLIKFNIIEFARR